MLDEISTNADANDANCVATGTNCPGHQAVMDVLEPNF